MCSNIFSKADPAGRTASTKPCGKPLANRSALAPPKQSPGMIPGFALRRRVGPLAEHTADHAADEAPGARGIATAVRAASRRAASAATTAGAATGGTSFIVARICGWRGCHDFGEQGL